MKPSLSPAPAVRGNMTPHNDAEYTGRMWNGQPVYKRPIKRYKKVPLRDPDGNLLYHLNADGTKRAPKWTNEVEVEWKEGIYVDSGRGIVTFQADAVPTVEQIDKKNRVRDMEAAVSPERLLSELRRMREEIDQQREALAAVGLTEEDLRRFRDEKRKEEERQKRRGS